MTEQSGQITQRETWGYTRGNAYKSKRYLFQIFHMSSCVSRSFVVRPLSSRVSRRFRFHERVQACIFDRTINITQRKLEKLRFHVTVWYSTFRKWKKIYIHIYKYIRSVRDEEWLFKEAIDYISKNKDHQKRLIPKRKRERKICVEWEYKQPEEKYNVINAKRAFSELLRSFFSLFHTRLEVM